VVPYNVLDVSGQAVVTVPVVTLPNITSSIATFDLTTATSTRMNLTVNSAMYSYLAIARITSGVTGSYTTLNPGDTSFVDTGLASNTAYSYSLVPYNLVGVAGQTVTSNSLYTLPNITSSIATFDLTTATSTRLNLTVNSAWYSYLAIARISGGVTGSYTTLAQGDTYFVDSGLAVNTMYSYSLVPYNSIGVAGQTVVSNSLYTLPVIASVYASTINNTNILLTLPADGSYSFYDISRSDGSTGTSTLVTKAPMATSTYTDTAIVTNTQYTYYVTPYTVSYQPYVGSAFVQTTGSVVAAGYLVQPVANGYFTSPDTASGTVSALNPVVSGWSILSTSQAAYYVGDGTVAGYYAPSGTTALAYYTGYVPNVVRTVAAQYLLLGSSVSMSSSTMYQSITVPSPGIYYLTWYAFAGASKDAGHSMSVTIGSVNAMYGILKGSSSTNTVPQPYTLPWLASAGNLSITVGFVSSTTSSATSYIGLTGVTCFSMATNSLGLTVVDPSALAVYCPLNTDIYDYSTGYAVTNITGGSVGPIVPSSAMGLAALPVGQGCLTLNGTSHALTLPSVTLVAGTPGLTVACWFYGSGSSQTTNATILSLQGAVALYYNGTSANLAVRAFGSTAGVTNGAIVPNTWNHVVMAIGQSGTVVVYVNGLVQTMSTAVGSYTWTAGSYTNNVVGYSTWTSAYTPGYFKGYVSDVRAYTRVLSTVEVGALWNFGEANVAYSMIDPVGMVMYYPDNHGTVV
jgi:hypothetical protein